MPSSDDLGIGLYSLSDAARLLQTPRRTLSRWIDGYVHVLRTGTRRYEPVIEKDLSNALSFGDLVELMYVRGFRKAGVSLGDLRTTASKFRTDWDTPYPLATKRFATDGKSLLIKLGGEWQHALSGQGYLVFDQLAKQLVHAGDLTSEWRPLGKDKSVVLDPRRAFGKPIEDTSGAHTYVLAQALDSGQDASAVAWWYGTTSSAVEDAAQFEHSLAMRGRDGDVFLR